MPGDDEERAIASLEETSGEGDSPEEKAAPTPPGRNPNSDPKIERPKTRRNVGIGGVAPPDPKDANAPFASNNAVETANEIARRFEVFAGLGDVYNIDAQVMPMDGTPQREIGRVTWSELVHPDIAPGDMLRSIITDRIHRNYATREMTYEVNFISRRKGTWISKNNKLALGSPAEIDRLAGVGRAPGHEPPAYRPSPAAPSYAQAPGYPSPGVGVPPGGSGRNPEVDALMDRMARTEGTLQEVLTLFREERQERRAAAGLPPAPVPAHAGVGVAPAPSPTDATLEERIARGVVLAMKEIGALGAPPQAPPSPNVPPPPKDPLVSEFEGIVTGVLREGVKAIGGQVRDQFRAAMAGVGAPPPEPEPEPVEPPEPQPAEPIPPPPFHVTEVGSAWPDGRRVMYATDSEGNMDLKGIAFANPILIEQGMKAFDKVSDGLKEFLSHVKLPNGTEVVGKTPKGAVDGTPRPGAQHAHGVGEPPSSPNNPRPPSPPPAPNGAPPKRGFPQG